MNLLFYRSVFYLKKPTTRDQPGRLISRKQRKKKRESMGTLKDKRGIVKKMKTQIF